MLLVLLVTLSPLGPPAAATPSPTTAPVLGAWHAVSAPSWINLNAVAMRAADDGWAVGGLFGNGAILRWNGTAWIPQVITTTAELNSVSVVSATDVWAVGSRSFFHWNGSTWGEQATAADFDLVSVSMYSSTLGWAVSHSDIFRWDGTEWNLFQSISPIYTMRAVLAVSPHDAWIVGAGYHAGAIIFHVTGDQLEGRQPLADTQPGALEALAGTGPNDMWAVGVPDGFMGGQPDEFVCIHLDGSTWWGTCLITPNSQIWLRGVSMAAPDDAWAVGDGGLILHWDGVAWSPASSPTAYDLHGVSMVSATDGWAVGYNTILHYDTSQVYLPVVAR